MHHNQVRWGLCVIAATLPPPYNEEPVVCFESPESSENGGSRVANHGTQGGGKALEGHGAPGPDSEGV